MKFKVGDTVECMADAPKGMIGIVKHIDYDDDDKSYLVEFPGWKDGHNGDGTMCRSGWWCSEAILKPVCAVISTADVPTAEDDDNIMAIQDAEMPKGRLLKAYEKFEAGTRLRDEACEEIEQILKEMRIK